MDLPPDLISILVVEDNIEASWKLQKYLIREAGRAAQGTIYCLFGINIIIIF